LFAPHLLLERNVVGLAVGAVVLLVALSFITGLADWLGAIALLLLVGLTFVLFPPLDALSQLYWAGIAIFVLVVGRPAITANHLRPWFAERHLAWSARAVAALR